MSDLGPEGFYGLSVEERRALTHEFSARRETLYPRWRQVMGEEIGWRPRLVKAAEWLAGARAVADLGSYRQDLEAHLAPGTRYIPIDCVGAAGLSADSVLTAEQRQRIVVVDFNRDAIPDLGVSDAAALGLLEYIYVPSDFMGQLQRLFAHVVLSYNIGKPKDAVRRSGHGWVNHFSLEECESLFAAAGFDIRRREQLGSRQFLWDLVGREGLLQPHA